MNAAQRFADDATRFHTWLVILRAEPAPYLPGTRRTLGICYQGCYFEILILDDRMSKLESLSAQQK